MERVRPASPPPTIAIVKGFESDILDAMENRRWYGKLEKGDSTVGKVIGAIA